MKKQYKKPALDVIKFDVQPLMVLSNSDNPQTIVNPDPYNDKFGSRDYDFDFADDEEW